MFEVREATFEVDGKPLLHPVSLDFQEGQIYGLIGHNGSGKSTLLKLLAQQQSCSSGHIRLDDQPLARWKAREFARKVAYLPQHLPHTDTLTCRELVSMGRYPWHGLLGRLTSQDQAQIDRALALTQTEAFADRFVDSLSGGERQRVWLAMLLAQESRYLLLDEPLAALDIAHQVDVLELVRDLSKSLGLAVIIVLHDINMAARYCDHLIALHSGRMLSQGTPHELMRSTMLKAIYGIALEVMTLPDRPLPIAVLP